MRNFEEKDACKLKENILNSNLRQESKVRFVGRLTEENNNGCYGIGITSVV
jgi:hypothetical protein